MRYEYATEEDESEKYEKTTSYEWSNEMSDHSVERLIDELNGLNEEEVNLIDEIEHTKTEEDKSDDIKDEDMHYDEEDENLRRTRRENYVTGV